MGEPEDPRGSTETPQNLDNTAKDGSLSPVCENRTVKGDDRETTANSSSDKDGVLDENANLDLKVERLQLKGLTEEDTQDDVPRNKKSQQKIAVVRTEADDETAPPDGRNMDGDDVMTPKYSDELEGGEEGKGEEEEEEEEPPEMTVEERKEMQEAVKTGDIDLLEDLLEKPNADIRMVYFNENLLITALRAEQLKMAEFLLDNGVDHSFITTWVNVGQHSSGKQSHKKAIEFYEYSCRQMAYDRGFLDIVEMIDILDGRLFPGIKPRERIPRFRRPPPTPSSMTSDTDSSSSSSGDESDISGEARSLLGVEESTKREAESSAKTMPTLDNEDGLPPVVMAKKQRRKTKKKSKEKTEAADEDVQCNDGEGEGQEGAGTVKESKKKKKRKRQEDWEEKDRGSAAAVEEGSTAGRSRSSQGDRGDMTDRSRGTAKSSEQTTSSDKEEDLGGQDEGYETMSPSPSHLAVAQNQQPLVQRFQPPKFPVKPTKAYLALRRTTETHKQHCIPAKFNEARPLNWRKVKSAGSYEVESPFWHRPTPSSPKLPPPTPAGTATTVCMLSPRSGIHSRSDIPSTMVSTIDISSGNITKPKILNPSHRVSSSKSTVSTTSSGSVNGSVSISSTYTPNSDRLYPLKLKVPSYMRMTTSCFVKRRLEPNFTNTYSSLDFVEPSPSGFSHTKAGEDSSTSSRVSSGSSGGVIKKAINNSMHAGNAGFPTMFDIFPSVSPSLRRKTTFAKKNVASIDKQNETVPNIRNKSSVIQTSKVTSVSAAVR